MKQTLMKFPNGFRVVLSSRASNVVTISVSLLFGAEQEKKNISGITHFIERLIRSSVSRDVAKLGGIVETKTDYEHLELTVSTVRENLEEVVKSITTNIFEFGPTYAKFKEEQSRILQEIENRKVSPLAILSDLTQKNRYKTTSLATELIGTAKTILELDLESLREYYHTILSPNHLLVSVVGNISDEKTTENELSGMDEVVSFDAEEKPESIKLASTWNEIKEDKSLIEKVEMKKYNQDSLNYIKDLVTREFYSRTIPLKEKSKRRTTAYFPLKQTTIITKNKNLNQSRFHISFPSAPYSSTAYKYSKLFELYLSNYIKSGLADERGVYGMNVYISQFKNNAHINIVFAVDSERAEELYKKIIELLKGQRQESIRLAEFKSLKLAYKTMISLGHEKMSDLARRYNKWMFLKGELFNLTNELKAIEVMDFESFRDVTRKMINFNSMLVVYLGKPLPADALKIKK